MKNRWYLFVFVFFAFALQSCFKEVNETIGKTTKLKEVTWDPAFAAPLVNTKLEIKDLIRDVGEVKVGPNDEGTIVVSYKGEVMEIKASDFISINNQFLKEKINLTSDEISSFNSNGSVTLNKSFFVDFDLLDLEISELEMFVCNHLAIIQTDIPHDVSFEVDLPDVTFNGTMVEYDGVLLEDGSGLRSTSSSNSLARHRFIMNRGPLTFNQLEVVAKITITANGSSPITTNQFISIQNDFIYNEFETLKGFVGKYSTNLGPEVLEIPIYTNAFGGGTFTLVDPRVKMTISNSFGVPFEATVNRLDAIKGSDVVAITGLPNPLPIPKLQPSQIGETLVDSFTLTKENSNFVDAINLGPDSIVYGVSASANSNVTTEPNFVTKNSALGFAVEVDVPLWGTAQNYSLVQEQPFELALDSVVEINSINMRLYTENSFPLDLAIQVYFLDSIKNMTLDSLFEGEGIIIDGAVMNAQGNVEQATINVSDVFAGSSRIQALRDANKVSLKARFNTTLTGGAVEPVKIKIENNLVLKLGVDVDLKVTEGI